MAAACAGSAVAPLASVMARAQQSGYGMSISRKVPVATLGVPRIGRRRELKFALESYWSGKSSADDLLAAARALRAAN